MKVLTHNCDDWENLFSNDTDGKKNRDYNSGTFEDTFFFISIMPAFIMFAFACLIGHNISYAGTKAVFATVMNGNWTTTSIWNPAVCPGLSDEIIIRHSVANFTNPSLTGSILIESSGMLSSLDMIVSNGATLMIYGTLNLDNLTLNNGSTLCIFSSGIVAISGDFINKNNTINVIIDGNLIVGGNFTNGFGGIISGSGVISVSGIFDGAGTTFSRSPTSSIPPNSSISTELPVELSDFNVVATDYNIIISWKTFSEINNDYFTIEKSPDCLSFTELTRVSGAGNSHSIQEYVFLDMAPREIITYYRIKQTDFDGQFKYYSQILAVSGKNEIDKISDVTVSPNPFTEDFYIRFMSEDQGSYILKIFDANSKCIFTDNISGNVGVNRYKINNLSDAPKGVYIISFFKNKEVIYSGKSLKY